MFLSGSSLWDQPLFHTDKLAGLAMQCGLRLSSPAQDVPSSQRGCLQVQASLIGMQRQMAVSVRSCGICGGDLEDFGAVVSARDAAAGVGDVGGDPGKGASVQLGCKHCFHPDCIRGWTIVGKKVRRRLWLRAKHGVSRMSYQAASQLLSRTIRLSLRATHGLSIFAPRSPIWSCQDTCCTLLERGSSNSCGPVGPRCPKPPVCSLRSCRPHSDG